MPASRNLVLLRHGHGVSNARDRIRGQLKPPLSPSGAYRGIPAEAPPVSSSFSAGRVKTSMPTRTRETGRIVLHGMAYVNPLAARTAAALVAAAGGT